MGEEDSEVRDEPRLLGLRHGFLVHVVKRKEMVGQVVEVGREASCVPEEDENSVHH
ncbi:hypothetical protein SLEP1_g50357 [Rubroshorea leprosula]|uniref:Uncharacterized protein n=1 Tax=Rubroshorea leprosula TaxID=152421 RepID=A0AAV5LZV6_9ROSI|nr:hypothetical protein SLEP1_g50357 [Rubroshorea leprosula]